MIDKKDQQLASGGLGRRSFINTAALVGLTAGFFFFKQKTAYEITR